MEWHHLLDSKKVPEGPLDKSALIVLGSMVAIKFRSLLRCLCYLQEPKDNNVCYSTIMSFYHLRSREGAKYQAVIHLSLIHI